MYGIEIGKLVTLVGGVAWCGWMLRRVAEHVRVLRGTAEPAEKAAVAVLWLFTLVVGMWVAGTTLGIVRGLAFVAG